MLRVGRLEATRGFTLFEVLVVLAIVSLVLVIAIPAFVRGNGTVELKSLARSLQSTLIGSRLHSIRNQVSTSVTIDVENRTIFSSADGKRVDLPHDISLVFDTAREELVNQSAGRIWFYPDGGSTGGQVELLRRDNVSRVSVDWLTGRVTISE